jgi:hypothetical protein
VNLRHKAIAAFRNSFNVASPVFAIPQRLAKEVDDLAEIVFLDYRIAPHGSHRLVFFQQAAAVFHQHQQGVEGPWRQLHPRRAMAHQTFARVQDKWPEFVNLPDCLIHLPC